MSGVVQTFIETHPVLSGGAFAILASVLGAYIKVRAQMKAMEKEAEEKAVERDRELEQHRRDLHEEIRREAHARRDQLQIMQNKFELVQRERDMLLERERHLQMLVDDRDRRIRDLQSQLDRVSNEVERIRGFGGQA